MDSAPSQAVDHIVEEFRQGRLTEPALRKALERAASGRQDLLYLQARSTSLTSSIIGMTLVRGGEIVPTPTGADEWPYASVLAALRDGWRIIKFPELALLMVDERTIGLGCEFILEKWN